MKRLKTFNTYINEDQLYFSVDNMKLISDTRDYIMDKKINEKLKFSDKLKNSLSKSLLGSMSYINMIDSLVNKLLDIEKETIKKTYDYEDDIDAIEIKIRESRRHGDTALIKTLNREMIRKNSESKAFIANQRIKIKNGIDLIEKAVGNNPRRKEYAKLKLSDKDFEISEFSYEYAKKKSSDDNEIKKLKAKYDKARKEAEELAKKFKIKI